MEDWQTWLSFAALVIALLIAVHRYRSTTPEKDAKIVDLIKVVEIPEAIIFDEASDVTPEQFAPTKKIKSQMKSRSRK